mmetsp:Transcript_105674/g.298663  ORF Transcript_105674/g.298663 Transcript_105674/m.298663 type:complete len:296 (+) Transcript_105674:103-990(+)
MPDKGKAQLGAPSLPLLLGLGLGRGQLPEAAPRLQSAVQNAWVVLEPNLPVVAAVLDVDRGVTQGLMLLTHHRRVEPDRKLRAPVPRAILDAAPSERGVESVFLHRAAHAYRFILLSTFFKLARIWRVRGNKLRGTLRVLAHGRAQDCHLLRLGHEAVAADGTQPLRCLPEGGAVPLFDRGCNLGEELDALGVQRCQGRLTLADVGLRQHNVGVVLTLFVPELPVHHPRRLCLLLCRISHAPVQVRLADSDPHVGLPLPVPELPENPQRVVGHLQSLVGVHLLVLLAAQRKEEWH